MLKCDCFAFGSLVRVLNVIRVYDAFVDVQTATNTLFNCCLTLPPLLSDNELMNSCPDESVDLNSLVTSNAPVNSILVWFDGVDPTVANEITEPEMVIATGVYYPFYYSNTDGTIIYTQEPNFVGVDSFTYIICDNGQPVLCDSAVVIINVIPVTDTTIISTDEDVSAVLCIDTLVNFGNFTLEDLSFCDLPGNGMAVIIGNSNCIEYTPNGN